VTEHRNAGDTCSSGGGAVGDSCLLKYVTVFFNSSNIIKQGQYTMK